MVAATSPALYIAVLACPVSMVVMMVWMMKGMGMGMGAKKGGEPPDEESLSSLKAQQDRLEEKVAELEARQMPTVGETEQVRV